MTKQEKYVWMTETDVRILVTKLSVPTIISMLITTIYNMADTYFVGHINTNATAAVGIVFPFMALIQACGFFFGHGSGNFISKELGMQRTKSAQAMASTGFFLSFGFGCLITITGLLFKSKFVYLLGSTEKIAPYAQDYLTYILIAAPFYASSLTLNNQFRFQGNAVYGMVGIGIGGILNVILDAVFVFVFNMGISGIALATAVSQIVSFFILFAGTFNENNISIKFCDFKPCGLFLTEILKGGAPSLFRQGLGSVANLSMNYAAKTYAFLSGYDKEAAIAAMSIVGKITHLAYSTVIGYGQGFQPVCGFNYGAKKYKRVKSAYFFSVCVTTVFMIFAGILFFVFAPNLVGFFNDDIASVKNQVILIGTKTLRITCLTFPFVGFLTLSNMMMQNLGMAVRASLLAMSRQGLFYIPLVFILPKFFGFLGIQMCQAISDFLSVIISAVLTYGVLVSLGKDETKELARKVSV